MSWHKNKSLIIIAVLAIFLAWLFLLLPFEVPDEQSHFASVEYLTAKGRMSNENTADLTSEFQQTQYIFGIMTDGTNKYAYNPSYHPDYTNSLVGRYEDTLASLNTPKNRSTYTIHQAAIYPPLYYLLGSIPYRLAQQSDIITRLYSTRFISVLLTIFTVFVSYFIGLQIWDKQSYARTIALLTLLFPMTTYIGVGVNSDNLHNLLFGLFYLGTLQLLKFGWGAKRSIMLGLIIALDLLTKPQAYLMLPILGFAVLLRGHFRNEWKTWPKQALFLLTPALFITLVRNPYVASSSTQLHQIPLIPFLIAFVHKLLSELIVWYWGVFKWTTIILPKPFWWLGTRLWALTLIGIVISIIRAVRRRRVNPVLRMMFFSLGSNFLYLAAIVFYDWQYSQATGHSLGMQARYLMPLLPSQLALMLFGLTQLGWNANLRKYIRQILIIFFVALQLAAVYVTLHGYYDLSSLSTLVTQLSQYKPIFAKGNWWYLWGSLYLISILYLTYIAIFPSSNTKLQRSTKKVV